MIALNKNLMSKFAEFFESTCAALRHQRLVTEMLNLNPYKAAIGTPESIGCERGACALLMSALLRSALRWPSLDLQIHADENFGEYMKT